MSTEVLAHKILRSLCANRPEEEDLALENYTRTTFDILHFDGPLLKLLNLLKKDYASHGGPPSTNTLRDQSAGFHEPETSLLAEEIGADTPEWGTNYSVLLEQYQEAKGIEQFRESLQEAAQIVTDGLILDKRQPPLKGLKDAQQYLIGKTIDQQKLGDPNQRSLANEEAVSILHQEYIARRDQPTLAYGMGTSFMAIDDATKGGQTGELWVVGGFTSAGKTTLVLNWLRYLAVEGGFNSMFFSLEMNKEQIWRILATGHSMHPKWGGRSPLEYAKIKSGALTKEDASFYMNELLPDLNNPDYGLIEVVTPVGHTTMSEIRARAEVLNRSHPLDVLVIDYIGLLGSDKKLRLSKNERINENLIAAKQMAGEFDGGNGLLVVSPHQINRRGVAEAQKNGGTYEIECLADANEAERSADVVIAIYQDPAFKQKKEAMITVLKNRDGAVPPPFPIYFPTENRYMADLIVGDGTQGMDKILEA